MPKDTEILRERARPTGEVRPETPLEGAGRSKPRSSGTRKLSLVALCLLIASGTVWAIWKRPGAARGEQGSASARSGPPPVPVLAGTVARKDVPIYLDGLGTVQAFNTVTVRARVDGQLKKIAFVEGQEVHAGDLLAQIDPDPFRTQVEQAEAKQGQDEAQLANARLQLSRDQALLAQKIIAQQDYDTQKALVDQLQASVRADQAAIESARVQLEYTTVVSPIDGRTGLRLIDQGNIVHANDANGLVVIAQLHPIAVLFTLPEQMLARIHQEMASGDLPVLAVDRDNRTVLGEGKLTVFDNQIDPSTGTIKLKATFPNADLRLWPGQFVNARLRLSVRHGGSVVPASVIQRGPEGAYVFVIKEDSTVQIRPVKVAQVEAGEALLEEEEGSGRGVQPGERVVVEGQYKLQPGSRVKLRQSAKVEDDDSGP